MVKRRWRIQWAGQAETLRDSAASDARGDGQTDDLWAVVGVLHSNQLSEPQEAGKRSKRVQVRKSNQRYK